MPAKVALCMITKGDEGKLLDRCLSTIAKATDGVFITITTPNVDVIEVCEKHGATYFEEPWKFHETVDKKTYKWVKEFLGIKPTMKVGDKLFRFDNARNYSFEVVPEEFEWILWLDVDDIFRGASKIRETIAVAEKEKATSVFLNYLYHVETDETGKIKNILIEHLRERFVKRGVYKWVAPIHETLIAQGADKKIDSKDCDVVHLSADDRFVSNLERNMRNLELSIFDGKGSDPRPTYYLAKAFYDLILLADKGDEYNDVARRLFKAYLFGTEDHNLRNKSGWAEERCQCWEFMAELYRREGKFAEAVSCGMNALMETDSFPSTYISISMSYLMMGDFTRAMNWLKKGIAVPQPKTTLVVNPKELEVRSHEIVYHHAISTQNIDQAFEAARMLRDLRPGDPEMDNRVELTSSLRAQRELTKSFVMLAKQLEAEKNIHSLNLLVKSAPALIANNPFVVDLSKKISPPKTWGKNEVALYCGPGFTTWSPKQLENPEGSFMGGSEEAVVYLSDELSKLGWKVTVYAEPGDDEGEYNGVKYLPHYKFNGADEFNILVSWRQVALVDANYKAKKTYIWNHDIQSQLDYTKERLDKIDKVIVLSQWHRENIPNVPDDKIMISANGVTL
jgi:tetratricopeptide (TPR) repeat protein